MKTETVTIKRYLRYYIYPHTHEIGTFWTFNPEEGYTTLKQAEKDLIKEHKANLDYVNRHILRQKQFIESSRKAIAKLNKRKAAIQKVLKSKPKMKELV